MPAVYFLRLIFGWRLKLASMVTALSVAVIENASQRGEARSATLPLPAVILEKVREGEALGPVMSRYTGIDEIGRKEGAIGVFTAGNSLAPASITVR